MAGLRLLWGAAWAEFLLVRLLSRVGIYIPKAGAALRMYAVAMTIGEVAFTFSLLLGVLLIAAAVWENRRLWPAAVAAGFVLVAPGVAPPAWWSLSAALLCAGAIVSLGAAAVRQAHTRWERGALAAVLAVQLTAYLVTAGQLAWGLLSMPGALPLAGPLLRAGELLAMLGPLLLVPGALALRGGARLSAWLCGAGAALALGLALLASGDMTAIFAMYALGFSLSWPAAVYLVALLLGIPGLYALYRVAPQRGLALGLFFLTGYALTLNQEHLLILTAWCAMAAPAPVLAEVTA
jgi:hypothetical protein